MRRFQPVSPALAGQRWQRFFDYRHARGMVTVPVVAPEISQVAAQLPLVFVNEGNRFALSVLVGLQPGVNHSLDEQNIWLARYTPAWLRTPPFRITVPPGGEPTQRVLSVDTQSPWYTLEGDEPLLDHQQQMTPKVKEVFEFLSKLERHLAKTQQAVDALVKYDVLRPWLLTGTSAEPLPDLYRIDEAAFNQLDDAAFATLRKKGALAIAYAQLFSVHQLPVLKQWAETTSAEKIGLDALFGAEDDELQFDFNR